MELLRKKRGVIKGCLTRLEKSVTDVGEGSGTAIEAQIKLEKLEETMKAFEQVQMELELLLSDDEVVNESNCRQDMENRYYSIKGWCLNRLSRSGLTAESTTIQEDAGTARHANGQDETLRQVAASQTAIATALDNLVTNSGTTRSAHGQGDLRLPRISLPSFGGDYREWPTFKDLFKTIVHDSSSLSGAQKLQFLKLSLRDDAASVLKHINISDANYEQSWSDLNKMYDKERIIIEAHIKAILDQQEIRSHPTAAGIRKIYNTSNESVSALKSLKVPVEHWGAWLVYVVSSKLDDESRKLWARASAANEKPEFKDILEFMSGRQFELESVSENKAALGSGQKSNRRVVCTAISQSCACCKGEHYVTSCPKFCRLDVEGKRSLVAQKGLCYNCLNTGHTVKSCKAGSCRICKARHHTIIHVDKRLGGATLSDTVGTDEVSSNKEREQGTGKEGGFTALPARNDRCSRRKKGFNLLPTAVILVRSSSGEFKPCRALLDSGSQVTLITERCVKRLGLDRVKCNVAIDGVGNEESQARGFVSVDIKSRLNTFSISSQAVMLRCITKPLPQHRVYYDAPRHKFELADPFFNEPGAIDILLTSGIMLRTLKEGKVYDAEQRVVAQNTEFGWVLASEGDDADSNRPHVLVAALDGLEGMLQRFWQIEKPRETTRYLHDEHPCETHFKTHYGRNEQGRFVVRLPFKDSPEIKGDSRHLAERRLRAMETRFARDPELYLQYKEFMEEYRRLGHMVEIDAESVAKEPGYYLPHHSVIKPDSTTTRLRVVFDATCTPPGGNSLNSQLLAGPVFQNDLVVILLQFMLNPIAITADIAKMYRQILIHEDDRRFQRVLWRNSPNDPMRTFQLTTVTYGTKPASFLATRCLTQLAEDGRSQFPEGESMIKDYFYMDDFIASCSSEKEAREIVSQLCNLLQGAGFNLRKFATNSKVLFNEIPLERKEANWIWAAETNQHVKTLGLRWHPMTDYFSFKFAAEEISCYTKRRLLTEAARVFDPLGFLAPFVVCYRILLQRIWQEGLDWDDQIPLKFIRRWEELRQGLKSLSNLAIPRYTQHNKTNWQMHGFCDASDEAYACVVYLCSVTDSGDLVTSIVAAKTKVVPLKPVMVTARLELCAAALLAKLIGRLKDCKGYQGIPVYGWTDSTIVLHWLHGHPRKYANFVANRISAITSILPASQWRHIKGEMNPADCASRGIDADSLVSHPLWWNGPTAVLSNPSEAGTLPVLTDSQHNLEERKVVLVSTMEEEDAFHLLQRYSSLSQLLRITAWIFRFADNCRVRKENRESGYLKVSELNRSMSVWTRLVQGSHFGEELANLRDNLPIRSGPLIRLTPFLDSDRLIRVGGRLEAARLGYTKKHPVILPYSSEFTKLVIRHAHHKYLHAGPQLLLALLRQEFWILRAPNAVKGVTRRCVICQRYRAKPLSQLMGNLPAVRLQGGKAFLNAGVDYAGPISATPVRRRGCRGYKVYIALFICLATKAIHLEMVTDLSTDAFLSALKRFTSRRGRCANLYSDNGTNFVEAKRILDDLSRFMTSRDTQMQLQE